MVRRSAVRAGQLLADHDVTATSKRVPPTRQGGRIVCTGLAHTFVNARTGESVPALDPVDLVIEPGEHVDFTVRFNPTTPAVLPEIATIRIVSNDPAAPVVDLAARGTHCRT